MHKDAVMSVSSPQLVELATGQRISPQDLGGSALHAEVTGFADAVRDSDEEVLAQIRSWLAYLPSSNARPAPVAAAPAESALIGQNVGRLVPEEPSRTYDMRAVVEDLADPGTCLELKPRYARNIITALARVHGYPVGIIANNPHRKAGAVDAAACDKATSMIVLCDSYNIPLVHLVDQPGFLVGRDAERQGIVGKVINWMNALSLCTVPKLAVIFNIGGRIREFVRLDSFFGRGFIKRCTLCLRKFVELAFRMLDHTLLVGIVDLIQIRFGPEPPILRYTSAGLSRIALLEVPGSLGPGNEPIV